MGLWDDIVRRGTTGEAKREDKLTVEIEEIKKQICVAAKDYVEDYISAMYEAGCTASEIQDQYEWALIDVETCFIVDRMEKKYQDRFWELDEDEEVEEDLCEYADNVLHQYADEMISELEDEEDEDDEDDDEEEE